MLPIFVRNWQTDECVVVNVGLSYVCSYCIIVMYHYTMRTYVHGYECDHASVSAGVATL